jgi:hypothetical protein
LRQDTILQAETWFYSFHGTEKNLGRSHRRNGGSAFLAQTCFQAAGDGDGQTFVYRN